MRCAVFGCSNNNKKKDHLVRFYRFPKQKNVSQLWINACCRQDKLCTKSARICSKHFTENDFERNLQHELLDYVPKHGPKLIQNVVPSLFLPKPKNSLVKTGITKREERAQKRNHSKVIEEILHR